MKAVNLWKTLFCAALALTTFSACSDDDKDDDGGMPSITVNGEASTTVAVKLDGGTTDAIEVVSTGSWVLTLDDETATWCHPSKETGSKGKTTLTFTVDKWEGAASDAERSVTAKLLTNGSFEGIPIPKKAEIIIKQNGDGSTDVTTNVKEIRALLKAMNLTESSTNVTTEIAAMTLTAIVVSDGEGNNMSNQYQIAVQDSGTEANSGLLLNATMFNTTKVTPGQVLTATLTKAKAQLKNGAIQLGLNDDEVQLVAGTAPAPIVITPDKIGDYEGQFVRIENCQPELDFVGKAWNTGSSKDGGNGGNVNFEFLEGTGTFIVFCGAYATSFCNNLVPEKSGYIQGISTQYKGTLEIAPRIVADFAGLTGDYKGPEYKTGTLDQIKADEYWETTATIAAIYTKGFLLADDTGYALVYNSTWNSQTDYKYAINQKVTVKGKVADFNGLLQFESPTITDAGSGSFTPKQATEFNAANLTAYESDMDYLPVTLTGVLSIEEKESQTSGKYYSYTVAVEGYTSKVVTLAYAFDSEFTGFATGDVVDATGFAIGTNFDKTAINIMLKTIAKNTTTTAVTVTGVPKVFAADGEEQQIAFSVSNAGNNKVYAEIIDDATGQFSVPTGEITSPVTVIAKANADALLKTAKLRVYLAASEGGNAIASDEITLQQAAKLSGNGFAKIEKVADIKAGMYYMAGYSEEYYNTSTKETTTFAPYSYHVWTGGISTGSNNDLITTGYEFDNNSQLIINPKATTPEAVMITLEDAGDGTFYIKYDGKYLSATAVKRKLVLGDTQTKWTFADHAKGGISASMTIGADVAILGTAGAESNMLRMYKAPASSLVYGLCFFKAN